MAAAHYSTIGHTADIGIRVRARTLRSLFAYAALAVFELSFRRSRKSLGKVRAISVSVDAEDLEGLFVNWLNELLSLSQAKGVVFSSFKIKRLDSRSISAEATFSPESDYRPEKEIKAVTSHQLSIHKYKGSWQAEFILDV